MLFINQNNSMYFIKLLITMRSITQRLLLGKRKKENICSKRLIEYLFHLCLFLFPFAIFSSMEFISTLIFDYNLFEYVKKSKRCDFSPKMNLYVVMIPEVILFCISFIMIISMCISKYKQKVRNSSIHY